MWEKSSDGSGAESVYVTNAIKNIYKSGVFRLGDDGVEEGLWLRV